MFYHYCHEQSVTSLYTTTSLSSLSSSSLPSSYILNNNTNHFHHYNNNHNNHEDDNLDDIDYIHIVLSFDSITTPQAMVAIASIITTSFNPKRLYFHLILINMIWDTKIINDFQISIG